VLTNPAMPGVVKIGRTSAEDVSLRLAQLYSTGVPLPFDLSFACRVPNSDEVEKALHQAFGPYRINPKREFFKIEPEQAIAILRLLHVEDATQQISEMPSSIPADELQAAKQYKAKRLNLNFSEMGIPVGAILQLTKGEATVTVASEKKVNFNGQETSLTDATRQLLALDYSVQPSPFWTYEGRTLKDLYEETYS